ncbi:pyrroloquinoline quinone biosynthesis protein PqqB [Pendulispora rubella]
MMRLTVLGSAAGGGFPQWNCGCPQCVAVRGNHADFQGRTQDSVAVTRDGESYVVVNASPDVLEQIKRTRALWPRAPRHSPIRAIVLTNGDMDHVLGLFALRESYPFALYATEAVWRGLEANAFLRTLQRFEGHVVWRRLEIGHDMEIRDAAGESTGVHLRAFAAPGKLPVHLMGGTPSPEDNVGLVFHDGSAPRRSAVYLTACAHLETRSDLEGHAALLFDGTFYREDELVRLGLSQAVAKDMAHVPITVDDGRGSLARLSSLPGRKIYTHINNTNPILSKSSEERRIVEAAGFEIAFDGMDITL